MLVVSDASPINFLVRAGYIGLLERLFQRVLIPPAVADELTRETTPESVRQFMCSPPPWLEIRSPAVVAFIPRLHAGETAAISLALEVRASLVLIDEWAARRAAVERGLAVVGLLGVLDRAAAAGWISLPEAIARVPADFRIDPAVIEALLASDAARGSPPPIP